MDIAARCWAFALAPANATLIRQLSTKCAQRLRVPIEDFQQDLQMKVAYSFVRFDGAKGTPANWIRYQAKGVCKTYRRTQKKQSRDVAMATGDGGETLWLVDLVVDPDAEDAVRAPTRVRQDLARVRRVLKTANPKQREAVDTLIQGLSGSEIRERYGYTAQARNHHLNTLRRALAAA